MKRTFLRRALYAPLWLLGAGLLLLAVNLKDPHLLAVRAWELPVLLLLALAGGLLFARCAHGLHRLLGIGAFTLVVVVALAMAWDYHERRAEVLADPARYAPFGRHLIAGYDTPEQVRPLIEQGLIGGVFLTRRNTTGKTVAELMQEIAQLQRWRAAAGLPPLWIAADQEGGIVSGLSPPLPRRPPLAALVSDTANDALLSQKAWAYGAEQGRALAELGVNLNFSPVVDLNLARPDDPLDLHSRIGERAISSDPAVTTAVAGAYLDGLASRGVRGSLKHFPGLGRVQGDTHHFSAELDAPLETLQVQDWLPFRSLADRQGALIMVGHVRLPALDSERPASFSPALIQGVIRDRWGHEGLLITDDLTMAAAYNHGLCTAAPGALAAGIDLLLVSWDHEKVFDVLHCFGEAKSLPDLAASVRRLTVAGH